MMRYEVHTHATAPERSRPLLEALQRNLGMVPNLATSMAESPGLLEGFLRLREIFYNGTFTSAEVQVTALTNAFENGCTYCMAFHSVLALESGVSAETVGALRAGRAPVEPRLAALSAFSRKLVVERGAVARGDVEAFVRAGFTKAQAL